MGSDNVTNPDCETRMQKLVDSQIKFGTDLKKALGWQIWLGEFVENNIKWIIGSSIALLCFCLWFGLRLSDWGDDNYIPREVYNADMRAINFKLDLLLKNCDNSRTVDYISVEMPEIQESHVRRF